MNKQLITKLSAILVVTIVIMVALTMIDSTIRERRQYHEDAMSNIAESSVRQQNISGPILILPYTDEYEEGEEYSQDGQTKVRNVTKTRHRFLPVFPDNLSVMGNIAPDQRYRGIHKVLVYSGQYAFSGSFAMPRIDTLPRANAKSRITPGTPFVSLGIADARGIHKLDGIVFDGKRYEFEQGEGLPASASGLHATLGGVQMDGGAAAKFSFDLKLDGIAQLSFVPVGKNNLITLTSSWPHPEFGGSFLPTPQTRIVTEHGFSASWDISSLASNVQAVVAERIALLSARADGLHVDPVPSAPPAHAEGAHDDGLQPALPPSPQSFAVSFIEPINVYSLSERAVKYGLLFVMLTFAAFFLFEMLKQLPVHPVQYGLVGLTLAIFFLLLISLSEQIDFTAAYGIASAACILLNGFYLSHVLRNWRRGFGFGGGLTLLYGVLYGVLQSENNALLMGSVLLFAMLAAVMTATRKVDWYALGRTPSDPEAAV
jgi:inner membrane protein